MAKTRRVRRRRTSDSALSIVRHARDAAKNALERLRSEIKATSTRLQKLVSEERSFRLELFGGGGSSESSPVARGRRPGRRAAAAATAARPGRRRGRPGRPPTAARRRGKPQAEKYFSKLPSTFGLDEVRKLAGRKAGISLAQWSRAKRIRKVGEKYQKVS